MGTETPPPAVRAEPPRPWLRFLDAATVVAITSGALYVYGWLYQAGFYRHFGLSLQAVGAATPDILLSSWGAVVAILLAAPCWLIARLADRTSTPALRPWAHNGAVLLYLLLLAVFWLLTAPRATPTLTGALVLTASALVLAALALRGVSVLGTVRGAGASSVVRAIVVVALLALLAVLATAQGRSAARELVGEGADYRPRIVLLMTDEGSWFHQRAFSLLLHSDGLYYLTPLDQGDRQAPVVFVLPQGDIEAAVLTRDADTLPGDLLDAIAPPATPGAP